MSQSCFIESIDPLCWNPNQSWFDMDYYGRRKSKSSSKSAAVSASQLELISAAVQEALNHCATYPDEEDYFEISIYESRKKEWKKTLS